METPAHRPLLHAITATALLACTTHVALAQKEQTHQKLVWFANVTTVKFNEHWATSMDIQERRFVDPSAQHQFLVRPTLIRTLGSGWDIGVGGCVFWQSPQDPESTSDLMVPELRPHLELNLRQKLRYFRVNQRYKAEARFFHNVEGGELAAGYTFGNYRFRYRLGLDLPLIKGADKKPDRLTLRLSDEVLINVGENIVSNSFDNNRAYVGLASNITPSLAVEVGFQNWFQERANGKDYYNRNILRLGFTQKINWSQPPATTGNTAPKG